MTAHPGHAAFEHNLLVRVVRMLLAVVGSIAVVVGVCAGEAGASESQDPAESRAEQPERGHLKGQWLLDLVPLGYADYADQLRLRHGITAGMTVSYMLARFAWLGAGVEWMGVGFSVKDSEPPLYDHFRTWRILARSGFGWGGRRVWGFWTLGFGAVHASEHVSNFDEPDPYWSAWGLGVSTGPQLAVTVHPRLSIGLRADIGWDFALSGELYTDRSNPLWLAAVPVFRVHL